MARRWRSLVFAAPGDGSVRRRPSDVVRLVTAVVLLGLLLGGHPGRSRRRRHLVDAVVPPPEGLHWILTALWFIGSFGAIAALAVLALLSRDACAWPSRRRWPGSGPGPCAGCWARRPAPPAAVPPARRRPRSTRRFPLARLAAAVAVAVVALPYLSRPVHRVCLGADRRRRGRRRCWRGSGLPIDVLASIVVGWGVAAVVHLALGSPAGVPTRGRRVRRRGRSRCRRRRRARRPRTRSGGWPASRPPTRRAIGSRSRSTGATPSDAQALAKLWRFALVPRRRGRPSALSRLQQVEHEAYLTLLAGQTGVPTPDVVVAGESDETGDAVLVDATARRAVRWPTSRPTTSTTPRSTPCSARWPACARRGIAHGAISGAHDPGRRRRVGWRCVTCAGHRRARPTTGSSATWPTRWWPSPWWSAPIGPSPRPAVGRTRADGRDPRPAAARRLRQRTPRAAARPQGAARPAARGGRDGGRGRRTRSWPRSAACRRSSLAHGARRPGRRRPDRAGVLGHRRPVVHPQERRLVVGAWSRSCWPSSPTSPRPCRCSARCRPRCPFGPTIGLELANAFTGLVAGTVGTTATIIRYFQRRGLAVSVAVSSGVLVSLANMAVQAILFVVAFLITRSSFTSPSTSPRAAAAARRVRTRRGCWCCSWWAWPRSAR